MQAQVRTGLLILVSAVDLGLAPDPGGDLSCSGRSGVPPGFSAEVLPVPLDQDVNEAISRLHFGATLPFWAAAVSVQALRLAPIQDWVVERVAATRRCDEGVGTGDDVTAKTELTDLREQRFQAGEGPFFYSTQDRVIRSPSHPFNPHDGRQIVGQLKPLGKEADAARVRNAFLAQFKVIKTRRDVTIHYDEHAIGRGDRRDLIVDPNEGLGAVWDDDGYIHIAWAGRRVNVLEAASADLDLSRALTDMFWAPALRP